MKRRAMALDPPAWVHPHDRVANLRMQARRSDSLAMAEHAQALDDPDAGFEACTALVDLGGFERAEQQFRSLCPEAGATAVDDCLGYHLQLLLAQGRTGEARANLAGLLAKRAVNFNKGDHGAVVSDFITLFEDVQGALKYARLSLRGNCMQVKFAPWQSRRGALLPEEIGTDPQWLACWQEPKRQPLMHEYRGNLVACRQGG